MSPAALFAAGWLAGVLTVVFLAIIGLRLSGESTDKLRDEYADQLGIGGGEILNHSQLATENQGVEHA